MEEENRPRWGVRTSNPRGRLASRLAWYHRVEFSALSLKTASLYMPSN